MSKRLHQNPPWSGLAEFPACRCADRRRAVSGNLPGGVSVGCAKRGRGADRRRNRRHHHANARGRPGGSTPIQTGADCSRRSRPGDWRVAHCIFSALLARDDRAGFDRRDIQPFRPRHRSDLTRHRRQKLFDRPSGPQPDF